MPDFQLCFEWEEAPRVHAPELDATWARLEIRSVRETITRVEVTRAQSIRTGIYVPLYPIAEWMVANWWFLWAEWRIDASDSHHSLLAAREGFALPHLTFRPTETKIELSWQPYSVPSAGVNFLSSGSSVLSKAPVREEFRRFVDAVIGRLALREVRSPHFAQDWQAIAEAEQDPEQRRFCEVAARLGCYPFDLGDAAARQIEQTAASLPESLADDFCDAVSLAEMSSGAAAVSSFVESASSVVAEASGWNVVRESAQVQRSETPWRDGYNMARQLRSFLDLDGASAPDLSECLEPRVGSLEIRGFAPPSQIDAMTAPSQTGAPVFGLRGYARKDQERFSLCRALADYLSSPQPSLVTRNRTEHQQRNRAFAAEFLAPAESIRNRLSGDRIGEDELDDLAREFRVSEYVIRHQIQNHHLASLA